MKIAVIGGTGFVGTPLVDELLQRGHDVTVLARNPAKVAPRERLRAVQADAYDAAQVAAALRGQDALVSAFNPGWDDPDLYNRFQAGARAIAEGAKRAGVRLLVVGGAGSLYVAPGVQLVDTPEFAGHVPPNVVPGAKAARDALTELQRLNDDGALDWVFLSPPPMLQPGARSGRYELGGDEVPIVDGKPGSITVADLAAVIADELETPRHRRQRFTAFSRP